jgi:hypothetical protein
MRRTYASEEDGTRREMQIHEVECDPTLQVSVDAIDSHLHACLSVTLSDDDIGLLTCVPTLTILQ